MKPEFNIGDEVFLLEYNRIIKGIISKASLVIGKESIKETYEVRAADTGRVIDLGMKPNKLFRTIGGVLERLADDAEELYGLPSVERISNSNKCCNQNLKDMSIKERIDLEATNYGYSCAGGTLSLPEVCTIYRDGMKGMMKILGEEVMHSKANFNKILSQTFKDFLCHE